MARCSEGRAAGVAQAPALRSLQSQEEYLLLTVRAVAQDNGWITYHDVDSRGSEKGWPDLAIARAPEVMFVELKSSSGRITKEQQRWIDELTACGVDARVVRYGTLEMAALFADLRKARPAQVAA